MKSVLLLCGVAVFYKDPVDAAGTEMSETDEFDDETLKNLMTEMSWITRSSGIPHDADINGEWSRALLSLSAENPEVNRDPQDLISVDTPEPPVAEARRKVSEEVKLSARQWEILIEVGGLNFDFRKSFELINEKFIAKNYSPLTEREGKKLWGKVQRWLGKKTCIVTTDHEDIMREILLKSPAQRDRIELFKEARNEFSKAGLHALPLGMFSHHLCTLRYEMNSAGTLMREKKSQIYTNRHKEIIKELVEAYPGRSVRDIFELASEKFAQERIEPLHFKTFMPRFTEIRAALKISEPSLPPKIGQKASDFLSQIYHDNPNLTPVVAWKSLSESGKFTPELLPSRESVKNWLKYRKRIASVSKT